MNIAEAIQRIDTLKPNQYQQNEKITWLSSLDLMIMDTIIGTHIMTPEETTAFEEKYGEEGLAGYGPDTPMTMELLVPEPYSELYISWLASKIDYSNEEYARYNNSAMAFNDDLSRFRNHYNATHMPKQTKFRYK